jgi:hypothetical protein
MPSPHNQGILLSQDYQFSFLFDATGSLARPSVCVFSVVNSENESSLRLKKVAVRDISFPNDFLIIISVMLMELT